MTKEEIIDMLSNFDCGPLAMWEVGDKISEHTKETAISFAEFVSKYSKPYHSFESLYTLYLETNINKQK